MTTSVRAFAPASAANLSAGYDVFGMALEGLGDIVEATWSDTPGVHILEITGDDGRLPRDPNQNTASVAAKALLEHIGESRGVALRIHKKMPFCSGLGSSAASAAAAVYAINTLCGAPLSPEGLVPLAAVGEAVVSGAPHADNVAPSLLGGVVAILPGPQGHVVRLAVGAPLFYAIVYPDWSVSTKQARTLVPEHINTALVTEQLARCAGFVHALAQGDWDLLAHCLFDNIAEPARAQLIPGFSLVRQAALDAGAIGAGLSGSGPSLFALAPSASVAQQAAQAMANVFEEEDIAAQTYVGQVGAQGARCLDADETIV